ncbi:hypothetical protein C8R43DRAFT_964493 [Mycena crocata]|nr:hypothetical protein C8R43DRAFT_964493 [Mycena crocata]
MSEAASKIGVGVECKCEGKVKHRRIERVKQRRLTTHLALMYFRAQKQIQRIRDAAWDMFLPSSICVDFFLSSTSGAVLEFRSVASSRPSANESGKRERGRRRRGACVRGNEKKRRAEQTGGLGSRHQIIGQRFGITAGQQARGASAPEMQPSRQSKRQSIEVEKTTDIQLPLAYSDESSTPHKIQAIYAENDPTITLNRLHPPQLYICLKPFTGFSNSNSQIALKGSSYKKVVTSEEHTAEESNPYVSCKSPWCCTIVSKSACVPQTTGAYKVHSSPRPEGGKSTLPTVNAPAGKRAPLAVQLMPISRCPTFGDGITTM